MFKTDIDIPEERGYIFAFILCTYFIWPEKKKKKMHYRLWVLYGKRKTSLFSREKLEFRFSSKDRYHCGLAKNYRFQLKKHNAR